MRRIRAATVLTALVLACSAHGAEGDSTEPNTVFHYAEKAWAVGTIRLGKPLPFREGKVLVFPSQITDLTWAPKNAKPRNLMVVYELSSDEKDNPFFKGGEEIFAPIRLLPDHSYWKDNLPTTPRHQIAGGRRHAFQGDDLSEAKRIIGAYLKDMQTPSLERWKPQLVTVASALVSPVAILREDAVRFLAGHQWLARDFTDAALQPVRQFLTGTAPDTEKATLIDALAAAKVTLARPAILELAARDDASGAAALRAMSKFGDTPEPARLVDRSRSSSPEVRAAAAEALGKQAANEGASTRAVELLDDDLQPPAVREAAARGLAESRDSKAQAALVKAVDRGDAASKPSAEALAATGAVSAVPAMIETLEKREGAAAYAAATGLSQMKDCAECGATLRKQHAEHKDETVRHLIGIILGVPMKHEH